MGTRPANRADGLGGIEISEPRKLGRPRDTRSEDTRQRILESARGCFSRHGYEATTNRDLAEAAGLTSGALYHYFGSKLELYIAVHDQVGKLVYERFQEALKRSDGTFIGSMSEVLDESHRINSDDPTLGEFLGGLRSDVPRHPELVDEPTLQPDQRYAFFGQLVDQGITNDEIRPEDREMVLDVVSAILVGLITIGLMGHEAQAQTMRGLKRLIAGTLLLPPGSDQEAK